MNSTIISAWMQLLVLGYNEINLVIQIWQIALYHTNCKTTLVYADIFNLYLDKIISQLQKISYVLAGTGNSHSTT